MVSVVVPAHDEAKVIGRLLGGLLARAPEEPDGPAGVPSAATAPPQAVRVVVVCNGCTDTTAEVARGFAGVSVLETPVPSKREALRLGDDAAGADFPRLYIDADVEIDAADVQRLAAAVTGPGGLLAAAPRRLLPRQGMSLPVRWYYDVWQQLPQVRSGIFGRGVIALSAQGHQRVAALPLLMSDDLAMSAAFEDAERAVVQTAQVVVHPPRTWADLVRRRVRAATGTAQAYADDNGLRTDSRTSRSDLLRLARHSPALAMKLPVFLAVAVIARRRASRAVARGDFSTWLRDESSRTG